MRTKDAINGSLRSCTYPEHYPVFDVQEDFLLLSVIPYKGM